MDKKKAAVYYKVIKGKYMSEIPKGHYGSQFSSYNAMRKAVSSKFRLIKKKKWNKEQIRRKINRIRRDFEKDEAPIGFTVDEYGDAHYKSY